MKFTILKTKLGYQKVQIVDAVRVIDEIIDDDVIASLTHCFRVQVSSTPHYKVISCSCKIDTEKDNFDLNFCYLNENKMHTTDTINITNTEVGLTSEMFEKMKLLPKE